MSNKPKLEMSGWEIFWEILKMIVLGSIALLATGGKSCDMPKEPTQQERQHREQDEFFRRLDRK